MPNVDEIIKAANAAGLLGGNPVMQVKESGSGRYELTLYNGTVVTWPPAATSDDVPEAALPDAPPSKKQSKKGSS